MPSKSNSYRRCATSAPWSATPSTMTTTRPHGPRARLLLTLVLRRGDAADKRAHHEGRPKGDCCYASASSLMVNAREIEDRTPDHLGINFHSHN